MGDSDLQHFRFKLAAGPLRTLDKRIRERFLIALNRFDSSSVDCWIKLEVAASDLKKCLHRFQLKHGVRIDWNLFEDLVNNASSRNPSSHAQCEIYFDPSSEALVHAADRHISE